MIWGWSWGQTICSFISMYSRMSQTIDPSKFLKFWNSHEWQQLMRQSSISDSSKHGPWVIDDNRLGYTCFVQPSQHSSDCLNLHSHTGICLIYSIVFSDDSSSHFCCEPSPWSLTIHNRSISVNYCIIDTSLWIFSLLKLQVHHYITWFYTLFQVW